MGDYLWLCEEYFDWDKEETIQLLITALVAGFVLSFNNWGSGDNVNIAMGVQNLVLGVIFVAFSMGVHVLGQKLMGLKQGYVVKYGFYKLGLLVGVLVTFLTNGIIPLFFTGKVDADIIERIRVGKYEPRFKQWEAGLFSFAGPFANLILILIAKPIYIATQSSVVMTFIHVNLFIMIYSMLPVPFFHGVRVIESGRTAYDWEGGTPGFNLFIGKRWIWVLFFGFTVAYSLLAMLAGLLSFFLSLLIAILITIVFWVTIESEVG